MESIRFKLFTDIFYISALTEVVLDIRCTFEIIMSVVDNIERSIVVANTEPIDTKVTGNAFSSELAIQNHTGRRLYVYTRNGCRSMIRPTKPGDNIAAGVYIGIRVYSAEPIYVMPGSCKVEVIHNDESDYFNKSIASQYQYIHQLEIESNIHKLMYIAKYDIAISFNEYVNDEEHPFSEHGIVARALKRRGVQLDEATANLGFILVNSHSSNIGPRYINVAGRIFSIKPSIVEGLEPGLHVNWTGQVTLGGETANMGYMYYSIEDMESNKCEFQLYNTYDEAHYAANSRREIEALIAKEDYEERKRARELESIAVNDQLDLVRQMRKSDFEEKSFARKEYYDSVMAERKDSADMFKWGLTIAGIAIALVKTGNKASSLIAGFDPIAITTSVILELPSVVSTVAKYATKGVLAVGSYINNVCKSIYSSLMCSLWY